MNRFARAGHAGIPIAPALALSLALALLAPSTAAAVETPPAEAWTKTFIRSRPSSSSVLNMDAEGVATDSAGNAYVLTTATLGGSPALVKYTPSGDEAWMLSLDGLASCAGISGNCVRSSNLFAAGNDRVLAVGGSGPAYTTSATASAHLVDPDGKVVWTHRLAASALGATSVWFLSAAAHPDGGYVLGGYYFIRFTGWATVTIRLAEDGTQAWRILGPISGSLGNDAPGQIAVDASGAIYSSDQRDLSKLDASGGLIWKKAIFAGGALRGADDGFLLAKGNAVIRYDGAGSETWRATWGNPDTLLALDVAPDGSVLAAGYLKGSCNWSDHCQDAIVYKYAATGERVWMKRHDAGAGYSEYFKGVAGTPDGDVYVAGQQWGPSTGHFVVVVQRLGGFVPGGGSGGTGGGGGAAGGAIELPKPPIPAFTFAPKAPSILDEVRFTDQTRDPDGQVVSWLWDFGDGTRLADRNPAHKYAKRGSYAVVLEVTDSSGLVSKAARTVRVGNAPPVADFIFAPDPAAAPALVTFADASTDVDGRVVAWSWDFGDGSSNFTRILRNASRETTGQDASPSTSPSPTISHAYPDPGSYVVRLTVTDDEGASTTVPKTVHVLTPEAYAEETRRTAEAAVEDTRGKLPIAPPPIEGDGDAGGDAAEPDDASRPWIVTAITSLTGLGAIGVAVITRRWP